MKTNAVEVALTNADKVSNDNQLASDVSSTDSKKGLDIANDATAKADDAVDQANKAVEDAGFANDIANDAKESAADATNKAGEALSNANDALTNADTAVKNSNDALEDAANALKTANDSSSKASQAQQDANNATAKAEDAISAANKAQGDATAALGNSSTAISNAQDALDKYNNLNIGNRNYLLGTKTELSKDYDNSAGTTNLLDFPGWSYVSGSLKGAGFKSGDFVIVSYDWKVSNVTSYGKDIGLYFEGGISKTISNTGTNPGRNGFMPTDQITEGHTDTVFQLKDGVETNTQSKIKLYITPGFKGHLSITHSKLASGQIPTDWESAMEDVEVEITNIDGELSQKVSQTDYDSLKGTVKNQETQITQNATDIKSKANQSAVDTINKTVEQQGTELAQNSHDIQLKADSSTVNEIKGTVDSNSAAIKLANDQIDLKADKSQVNTINKTVQQNTADIGVNANAIKLKADSSTVDNLAGRVTKAEGELTVQADKIAQTVSKTELDDTLGDYATQKWTQGQITTASDEIKLSVQEVQSNVDNLNIDGRNYFMNSEDVWTATSQGGPNENSGESILPISVGNTSNMGLSLSSYMTISYDYEIIGDNTSGSLGVGFDASPWEYVAKFDLKDHPAKGNFAGTIKLSDYPTLLTTNPATRGRARMFGIPTGTKVHITHVKLDKNSEPSLWSPAPEDAQSQIDNLNQVTKEQGTSIKLNSDQIALKADQTTVDNLDKTVKQNTADIGVNSDAIKLKANQSNVDTLAGRVTDAEGKLTVQAGQIAQTVSKTELDDTLGDYATQTWTQGEIKTAADDINLSVQKVQSNVDNLNIGSRNLILDSQFNQLSKYWNGNLSTEKYGESNVLNVKSTTTWYKLANYGSSIRHAVKVNVGDEFIIRYKVKVVGTSAETSLIKSYMEEYDSINSARTQFENIAAVDGTISGWQTITGIYTIKGSTTKYISFVPQFPKAGGEVLFTEPEMYQANKLPANYSPAPEDTASATDYANLEIKVNGIQGTVANKADKSQVTQLADQVTSVVSDVDDNTSQLTQMAKDINLRVKEGDVVNQINIDDSGILIDGKKTHITGQTTIDNAAISDAAIANLSADKLTAGTITASNVQSGDGNFVISTSVSNGGSLAVKSEGTVVPAHGDGTEVPYTESYYLDKNGIHEKYTQSTPDGIVKYDMSSWLKDGSLILKQGPGTPSADPYLEAGKDYIINYNGAHLPNITAPKITLGNIDINNYHTISSLDAGALYFMDSDVSGSPIPIKAKDFVKSSELSKKTDISEAPQGYASDLIWGMDYRLFRYKADGKTLKYHLGGVIDDVNDQNQFNVPDEFMDENNEGISTSNQMAWQGLALQELMQQVSDLSLRVTKLELENKQLKGE